MCRLNRHFNRRVHSVGEPEDRIDDCLVQFEVNLIRRFDVVLLEHGSRTRSNIEFVGPTQMGENCGEACQANPVDVTEIEVLVCKTDTHCFSTDYIGPLRENRAEAILSGLRMPLTVEGECGARPRGA